MVRYVRWVIRYRWLVVLLLLGVTVVAGALFSKGRVGSSVANLFLGENPNYHKYLEKIGDYGEDDVIVVALNEPQLLSDRSRARIATLSQTMARLPSIEGVRSVLDVQRIDGDLDAITVQAYAELVAGDPKERAAWVRRLTREPFARGLFVSDNGRWTALLLELDSDPNRKAEDLPKLVSGIFAACEVAGYRRDQVHVVGLSATVAAVIHETQNNLRQRFPVVLALLLLTVWLMFRRLWPVMVNGVVALVAVSWTMGLAVALDPNISVFTSIVPGVILIVAFSDVVHLCSAYLMELGRGKDKEAAILASCSEVGSACVFTSATTFVGFISLATVPTPASRTLGLVLGFGAGVALLIAVTLTPILLHWLPRPRPWRHGATGLVQDLLDRFLSGTNRLTQRRPALVTLAFALAGVGLVVGLLQVTIRTDFARRLADDHPLRRDQEAFRKQFAGANTFDIYVRTSDEGGLLDPELFARVARFQQQLSELPEVERVTSLVDLMRTIRAAATARKAEAVDLPSSRAELAQYLLLFEMSGGEDLDRLVNFSRDEMLLRVHLTTEEFRHTGVVGRRARELAAATIGRQRVTVESTGLVFLLGDFFNVILDGQKRALLIVFFAISLMMIVGLRSVRVGLWSMVPNLLPLFTLGGYLGLFWDYVDSDILMVAMIAIGIGVDDTIHFLNRYRLEQQRSPGDPGRAIDRTFAYSGRGIVITTVILVVGFSPFALSDYLSMYILGSLLPLTLVVALSADLLLVPALIKLGWIRFRSVT